MKSHAKYAFVLSMALCLPFTAMAEQTVTANKLSTYIETCPDEGCAEISAFDPISSRIFTTNATENELRILDIDADGVISELTAIDLSLYGGGPNSVAVSANVVAVAMQAFNKQDNGTVELFDTDGLHINSIAAGALPDMLTFTPDGQYLLVANEGEPSDDYTVDPEGSITIIDTDFWQATQVNFNAFDDKKLKGVRVFGPDATVSQDLEPEYIAVSADSTTAWITLQENNAIAKLDIENATITDVFGMGYKRHDQAKNAFDASDKDSSINIQNWPTLGMYQPDAIASYQIGKANFIMTANEGDARDYDGYSEEVRVEDLQLAAKQFPNASDLQQKSNLGRLKTTTANGDANGDGEHEEIYSFGGRSFSILNSNGKLVFDSGSQFEDFLAQYQDKGFDFWTDKRSDDKGPEPESITIGQIGDDSFAFIGLERVSGLFIYNVSSPYKPKGLGYIDLKGNGDIGPEGLEFIPRDSHTGWLLVTNEVSNTISLYEISIH